jgi:hypothetical protein
MLWSRFVPDLCMHKGVAHMLRAILLLGLADAHKDGVLRHAQPAMHSMHCGRGNLPRPWGPMGLLLAVLSWDVASSKGPEMHTGPDIQCELSQSVWFKH